MNSAVRKSIVVVAILLVAGGVGTLLALWSRQSEEAVPEESVRQVTTQVIELAPISRSIVVEGYVESRQTLPVIAQVGGEIVYSRDNVRPGSQVSRGELLVSIDSTNVKSELQLAETSLLKGLAALMAALDAQDPMGVRPKWAAFHTAIVSGVVPDLPSIESQRERLVLSTHGVIESYHALVRSGRTLTHHNVTAPFAGTVLSGSLPEGLAVSPGQHLVTLIDPVNLEIALSLTREELLYLNRSERVAVTVKPGGVAGAGGRGSGEAEMAGGRGLGEVSGLSGVIDRIGGQAERESQMVTVYVRFENPDRLLSFLPGSFVRVELSGDSVEGALLLARGLLNEDGTINVMEEGALVKYPVAIRGYRGDEIVVTGAGLRDGMELVTTAIQIPIEGMRLSTEAVDG